MKLLVVSIYDGAVGAYMTPFFVRSKAEAIRAFSDAVNDPQSQFYKHASDYALMCVGSFNDQDADLLAIATLEKLIAGHECQTAADLNRDPIEKSSNVKKLPM